MKPNESRENIGEVNSGGKYLLQNHTELEAGEWFDFEDCKMLRDGRIVTWNVWKCKIEDYSKIDDSAFRNAEGMITD